MKGGSHHSVLAFLGLAFYFAFYLPSSLFYSEVRPFLLPLKCLSLERLSGSQENKQGLRKYAVAVVLFITCVFSHHVYPTQCWLNTQPTSPRLLVDHNKQSAEGVGWSTEGPTLLGL